MKKIVFILLLISIMLVVQVQAENAISFSFWNFRTIYTYMSVYPKPHPVLPARYISNQINGHL